MSVARREVEKRKLGDLPETMELKIHHHKQRCNWDCGISCVLMVLQLELREHLDANFANVCEEEGFNKSTWTIDLCYLLRRYNVQHLFCTVTIGINPGYGSQSFYSKVIRQDERRVIQRFAEAENNGIRIRKTSLSYVDLIHHLATSGPVILLTNSSLLNCDTCKHRKLTSEIRSWLPFSLSYNGHYVVLCGYNMISERFLYRNPSYQNRICSMSFPGMDDARRSYGTDEDIILIYSTDFHNKEA